MSAIDLIPLRRVAFILFFVALILIAAYPVIAQDATSSTSPRKDRIEVRKEVVQQKIALSKEKFASREAALKTKLDKFRDQRKAQVTERVNSNLNKINENFTAMMLRHLGVMTNILDKLEARVNEGKPDIKDPTLARVAIADARTKISSASAAVTAQGEKDYTISVTSESRVKLDAMAQREQLHRDLTTLRRLTVDAKQSVSYAIRVAKSGKQEVSPEKEATVSGQQ